LTDITTPGTANEKLATIELKFVRCRQVWDYDSQEKNRRQKSAPQVNETDTKAISAVTECVYRGANIRDKLWLTEGIALRNQNAAPKLGRATSSIPIRGIRGVDTSPCDCDTHRGSTYKL
jgi:hypothetical protein